MRGQEHNDTYHDKCRFRENMDKAESKFTNMARRMDAAMLQLLEEKPFNAIIVTDVCKAAGAHRSTFYSHY